MDSRQPDMPTEDVLDDMGDEEEMEEITREELVVALQEVVRNLSEGLKGPDREEYLQVRDPEDELAQNDWFFAGLSDEDGQFAVTMWPAEGEEDMLRIDLGTEEEVHKLADDPDQTAALTDDFIAAMEEEYEEYDEDDEFEEDEEYEEEEFEEELEDEEGEEAEEMLEDEDIDEEADTIGRDGSSPPR